MTPILFIDRDGTLIEEPADFQVDRLDKLRLVRDCIPSLLRLRDAGWQFVMVTNQDGLGTDAFPLEAFEGPQRLLLQILESQGIVFRDILIDRSFPADNAPTRKPSIGLAVPLLRDRTIDWARSAVVGDRETDVQFARNLGVRGFQLRTAQFGGDASWRSLTDALLAGPRTSSALRKTNETRIEVNVDLDQARSPEIETGLGFFDHMLAQLGAHGGFALSLRCEGDLDVDEHHTVEDCALALGQVLREAVGDKRGIARYGFTLPMDEALASAALDWSGRSVFVFEGTFARERVGELPTELVSHFFRSLSEAAGLNLHLRVQGDNDHHKIEACFKCVGRALRQALQRTDAGLPSTKGAL